MGQVPKIPPTCPDFDQMSVENVYFASLRAFPSHPYARNGKTSMKIFGSLTVGRGSPPSRRGAAPVTPASCRGAQHLRCPQATVTTAHRARCACYIREPPPQQRVAPATSASHRRGNALRLLHPQATVAATRRARCACHTRRSSSLLRDTSKEARDEGWGADARRRPPVAGALAYRLRFRRAR